MGDTSCMKLPRHSSTSCRTLVNMQKLEYYMMCIYTLHLSVEVFMISLKPMFGFRERKGVAREQGAGTSYLQTSGG